MNVTDIVKDNTDYSNDTDWKNALVAGLGKANNPFLNVSPTALATATTIDDYIPSGKLYNNTGATAELEHVLPDPTTCTGTYLGFVVSAAYAIRLQPESGGSIYLLGSGTADEYVRLEGKIGNYMILWCDGENWFVVESSGTISKEGVAVTNANPKLVASTSQVALDSATTIADGIASGTAYNNTGAVATLEHILPAVASCVNTTIGYFTTAEQIARFQPASGEAVVLNGDVIADKYINVAAVISNYAIFWCDGTKWYVVDYNGVVTKEA